jgi:hypothetical protein
MYAKTNKNSYSFHVDVTEARPVAEDPRPGGVDDTVSGPWVVGKTQVRVLKKGEHIVTSITCLEGENTQRGSVRNVSFFQE